MAVHVHEAWDYHHPLALDGRIDRACVTRPDVDDLVALEHEIRVLEIDVSLLGFVPRHDVVEPGDPGRLHGVALFPIINRLSNNDLTLRRARSARFDRAE